MFVVFISKHEEGRFKRLKANDFIKCYFVLNEILTYLHILEVIAHNLLETVAKSFLSVLKEENVYWKTYYAI